MNNATDSYLEQQYNNRQAVPEFADYLLDWQIRSEAYRHGNDAYVELSYGSTKREKLDIFFAADPNAALHIFIHGGYWQSLNKESFSFMAKELNRQNETAIILNYNLCPVISIGQIVNQIRTAILWLYSEQAPASLNTDNIQISGHSAGGHLVAEMLATDWVSHGLNQSPFKRATSLSGLFDLKPLIPTTVNHALGLTKKSANLQSPINKSPVIQQPTVLELIVGELESEGYKNQSIHLARRWSNSQLNIDVLFAAKQNHFSLLQCFLDQYYTPLKN